MSRSLERSVEIGTAARRVKAGGCANHRRLTASRKRAKGTRVVRRRLRVALAGVTEQPAAHERQQAIRQQENEYS